MTVNSVTQGLQDVVTGLKNGSIKLEPKVIDEKSWRENHEKSIIDMARRKGWTYVRAKAEIERRISEAPGRSLTDKEVRKILEKN